MSDTKKPVHKIRRGAISASIWRYENTDGENLRISHAVTFQKSYLKDGNWENTNLYGRDDLLLLSRVAVMASDWIFEQGQKKQEEPPPAEDIPW